MSIYRSVEPAVEPVTTADMKSFLRVDTSDDDTLIASMIKAVRMYIETVTRRAIVESTFVWKLDKFPDELRPPRSPLVSVSSIQYIDTAGTTQTFSNASYSVDRHTEPGRISLVWGESWPETRDVNGAVTVTFVAGYTNPEGSGTGSGSGSGEVGTEWIPETILACIKLLVADMYEHREAGSEIRLEENKTVDRLLWSFKIVDIQ